MRYIVLIIVMAFMMLVTVAAFKTLKTDDIIYSNSLIENTPEILLAGLNSTSPLAKENYIKAQKAFIKFNGRNPNQLDILDLKIKADKALAKLKLARIKEFERYDFDKNGVITEEDINNLYKNMVCITFKGPPGNIDCAKSASSSHLKSVLQHDQNEDGQVTYDEMTHISVKVEEQVLSEPKEITSYVNLDPNGDGILTSEELEKIASDTFDRLSQNNSGQMTEEALNQLREDVKNRKDLHFLALWYRVYCGNTEEDKFKCMYAHEAYDKLTPKQH